jgi:hypothetical protein
MDGHKSLDLVIKALIFFWSQKRVKYPTRRPLLVHTLVGEVQVDEVCSNISLVINKKNFTVTLIVLESLNIPVVLSNGWLCAHKGAIHGT